MYNISMKKSGLLRRIAVIITAFLMLIFPTNTVFALSSSTLDRFAENNILFYDPGGGCNSVGGVNGIVTILPGSTAGEKIWNWFASAGIAGVSDNAAVISGIMGNLITESSLNPFVVSSLGYYGLYQAGGGRATSLQNAFASAGLSSLWRSSPSSVTNEQFDTAIDVTLTHLTTADDGSFRTFVSRLGAVDANTPEAYSDMFLVTVERAVGGNSPILDSGAKRYSNGGDYQGSAGRRTNAVNVFNTYSGSVNGEVITRIRTDTQSATCDSGYMGSGELISGGMTLDQAKQFMQPYRSIQPRNYEEPGGEALGRWSINNLTLHSRGGSCLSDLENCVAFTQYFICEYANVCMGLPDGGKVVDTLLNSPRGFIEGGTTPRVYAVFSSATHTGIVLGIDKERDKIVIGEAGCGNTIDWTNAHEYSLSSRSNGSYKYAYTDNILKGGL